MNYQIKAIYNRRKNSSNDKPSKIEIEVYLDRKNRKYFNAGIEIYNYQWDNGKIVNHKKEKELNNKLKEQISLYNDIIKDLISDAKKLTIDNFISELDKNKLHDNINFIEWCYDEAEHRNLRASTLKAHHCAFEALKRFGEIKTFDDVTYKSIAKWDDFLRKEDPSRTQVTLHNYHKRLRTYISKAIRLGYIDESPYIRFRDVRGNYKVRTPLTEEEVQRIETVVINNSNLDYIRDLFVFQIYTGLCYADLCQFTYDRDVVKNGTMTYINGERLKTGTKFFTPILGPAMGILKKHNYKFKIPTMQAYNRLLKCLGVICDINKNITSHIARHTFATTIILAHDVPIEVLSKMLGHTKIQVTQVYAKLLNSSVERQAERLNQLFK